MCDKDTNVPSKTEYISREAMHRANKHEWDGIILKGYNDGHQVFIDNEEMIDSVPAADVVEVVRCRDCKFSWETDESDLEYKCIAKSVFVSEAWYCADGQRRQNRI